jgi:hypothetical protein
MEDRMFLRIVMLACVLLLLPGRALPQGVSAEDANKSNNPLNPAIGLAVQDLYSPRLYGSDAHTNDLLMRATIPVLPSENVKLADHSNHGPDQHSSGT